jgi:hypothetical protein
MEKAHFIQQAYVHYDSEYKFLLRRIERNICALYVYIFKDYFHIFFSKNGVANVVTIPINTNIENVP